METFKDKILKAISKLPADESGYLKEENADVFPAVLNEVTGELNNVFKKENLVALMQNKEKSFDFLVVVTELLKSFKPLNGWIDSNKIVFEKAKISSSIKDSYGQLGKNIQTLKEELIWFDEETSKNLKAKGELNQLIKEKETRETKYKQLLSDQAKLEERKNVLIALENQVKEGKLEELENNNLTQGKLLNESETKRDALVLKRDELLSKQKELEGDTQKIIKQTELIGNTTELFLEFQNKCTQHNEKMIETQRKEGREVGINLEFTSSTSSGVMDNSMHEKIKRAKHLVKEVEDSIKEKLK